MKGTPRVNISPTNQPLRKPGTWQSDRCPSTMTRRSENLVHDHGWCGCSSHETTGEEEYVVAIRLPSKRLRDGVPSLRPETGKCDRQSSEQDEGRTSSRPRAGTPGPSQEGERDQESCSRRTGPLISNYFSAESRSKSSPVFFLEKG